MIAKERTYYIDKLKNHFKDIYLLFDESLKIDNEIFSFSFRKIMPLPFIFKRINYEELYNRGEEILKELINIQVDVTKIKGALTGYDKPINFILEYNRVFIETQTALNKVSEQMYLKSENKLKVNYSEYNALVAKYKALDTKRASYGLQMNEIASILGNVSV